MQRRYAYDVRTDTSHYNGEVMASSESEARASVERMYPNAISINIWEK